MFIQRLGSGWHNLINRCAAVTGCHFTHKHPCGFISRFFSPRFQPPMFLHKSRLYAVPRRALYVCAALLLFVPATQANSLQEVVTLAEQGAPELALRLIDQQQSAVANQSDDWLAWEKARILIYQQCHDWQSVVRRVQALPDGLPAAHARWAFTQGAAAQLELGQGAAAREWLLRLIWEPATVSAPWFAQWRSSVIRSYILDGRVSDAYAAMRRYQQDYGNADEQARVLHAQVLLLAGHNADAAALLADAQQPEARALHLLARLRGVNGVPEKIMQETTQLIAQQAGDQAWDAPLAAQLWAVQAEAAQLIGMHERRVEALEYVMALAASSIVPHAALAHSMCMDARVPPEAGGWKRSALADELFNLTTDTLWDAYVAYAQMLGNQQQLLMGDFAPWLVIAQTMVEAHPVRARALFAFLAMRADTVEMRVRAHRQLIALAGQHPHRAGLTRALYHTLDRFH